MDMVSSVADRYMIRKACESAYREIRSTKLSSMNDGAIQMSREFSVELLEAFAFPFQGRIAAKGIGIKDIAKKVKAIWGAFKKAPKYWDQFKEMLGVKSKNLLGLVAELPKKLMAFFKQGMKAIGTAAKTLTKSFGDFIKVFSAISSQTALFNQLMEKIMPLLKNNPATQWVSEKIDKATNTAKNFLSGLKLGQGSGNALEFFQGILDWLLNSKISNALGTPLKAYVFFNIWINVTEISWDFMGIIRGMLGLISWKDLFASLPESGVGFLIAMFIGAAFPSIALFGPQSASLLTKITGNWLMFVAPVFQIIVLVKNKLIQYGKSAIKFFWEKIGIEDWKEQGLPETIAL